MDKLLNMMMDTTHTERLEQLAGGRYESLAVGSRMEGKVEP